MSIKKLLCLLFIATTAHLTAKESDEDEVKQLKIGNLAVSGSQQISPLLGFGQTVVDKGDLLLFLLPDFLIGHHKKLSELIPCFLYGIRDDLSFFLETPIAARFESEGNVSSGPEDMIFQLEYAFFHEEKERFSNAMTLVTTLLLPFGDDTLEPSTGFGSTSFFLGLTASHIATDWYYYVSPGAVLTTSHDCRTKSGNQFLYQAGIGKNIAYSSDKWVFSWLIELIGTYTQKSKVNGVTDQNSGSNIVLLAPSLWFSTQKLIIQASIGPFIYQHLFGQQQKNFFLVSFNFGWKFN